MLSELRRLLRREDVYDAYCALLALPDPDDLPVRGRHYVFAGDALRRDQIKHDLACAYIRWRMFDAGEDVRVVSVRRSSLRLVEQKRA